MNTSLQSNILNQIKSAVSGTTSQVHFLHLPDRKLLKEVTVTYQVQQTDNETTFDSLEGLKTYQLQININAPTAISFGNLSIYIRDAIKRLVQIDENVHYVRLNTEDVFWDDELEIFTELQLYEIQYS